MKTTLSCEELNCTSEHPLPWCQEHSGDLRIADLKKQLAERDATIAAMKSAIAQLNADIESAREAIAPARTESGTWIETVARVVAELADEREHSKALEEQLLGNQKDAWNEAVEACREFILNGKFLHDEAPTKRFAHEVVAALKRVKREVTP